MTAVVGSLFTGYGGLDLAVLAHLGGRVAWHAEHEPPTPRTPRPVQAAARVLAHHHPDVPNHGDVTAIDWAAVEPVTVLTGGFPCQDVSSAGLRLGMRPDTRSGLWTHMAYAVDRLRPELVVAENVRGLLSAEADCELEPCPWCVGDGQGRPLRALGAVLGDLADLGYDARWGGVRASDVGAPHSRFRVFIVAWPSARDAHRVDQQGRRPAGLVGQAGPAARSAADPARVGRREGGTEPAGPQGRPDAALGGHAAPADPDGVGSVRDGRARRRRGGSAHDDLAATDAESPGLEGARSEPARSGPERGSRAAASAADVAEWGAYGPAINRWAERLGRPSPPPTVPGARGGGPQLSPTFVEWLMGLPAGWVTDVPGLTRAQQIKVLGNGVVPQQARLALAALVPAWWEAAA